MTMIPEAARVNAKCPILMANLLDEDRGEGYSSHAWATEDLHQTIQSTSCVNDPFCWPVQHHTLFQHTTCNAWMWVHGQVVPV